MTHIGWRLINILARLLEQDESDAVLGDFRDSHARAVVGLLGLIVRRQILIWKTWQPWVALIGVAGVSGVILSEAVGGLETIRVSIQWTQ